jgi:hypothetical protein
VPVRHIGKAITNLIFLAFQLIRHARAGTCVERSNGPSEGAHIAVAVGLNSDTSPGTAARARQIWFWPLIALWLASTVFGLRIVWAYDNTPGALAKAPQRWPAVSTLALAQGRHTLVVFAHPQCPCSRASLGELAELLARSPKKPATYVVFLKPAGFADGWEKTGLWQAAETLPSTSLVRDEAGAVARAFGVATSGQALLYDAAGKLRFNGGMTGSRGHAGDNPGRAALVALIGDTPANRASANVFGCPLFASGS